MLTSISCAVATLADSASAGHIRGVRRIRLLHFLFERDRCLFAFQRHRHRCPSRSVLARRHHRFSRGRRHRDRQVLRFLRLQITADVRFSLSRGTFTGYAVDLVFLQGFRLRFFVHREARLSSTRSEGGSELP